jgi:DNA-binding CsgD family transcriptional regulator
VQSDVLAGVVSAVALLLFVFVLDMTVSYAVPLSIALYAAVVLLRPQRARPSTELAFAPPPPVALRELEPAPAPSGGSDAAKAIGLTPRELEVLRLMADGLSNREIADALFIGQRTVHTHAQNILAKLQVPSRIAAVAKARKLDLH